MATDFGRVAQRPGPLHEHPPGMGVARFGDTSLPPPSPTGVFTGRQPQVTQELSGGGKATKPLRH
jgi:hypothetical protein